MKQIVVDSERFFEACGSLESAIAEELTAAAQHAKLGDADGSWIASARARSGARYLGWFYSHHHRCDVLVLNADGTLITD